MIVACSVQAEILKFLLQDYSEQLAASQYVLVGSAKAFLGQETFPANPSPLGKPFTMVNPKFLLLTILSLPSLQHKIANPTPWKVNIARGTSPDSLKHFRQRINALSCLCGKTKGIILPMGEWCVVQVCTSCPME